MGILDFFKKKKPATETVATAPEVIEAVAEVVDTSEETVVSYIDRLPIDHSKWEDVFTASLGKAWAIQLACSELILTDNGEWHLDLQEGYMQFSDKRYPVQVIGTESAISNTWLWAWENVNGFPPQFLTLANDLKTIAEKWQLPELASSKLTLSETIDGHSLAMLAIATIDEPYCYYRATHDNGAVYVALKDVDADVFAQLPYPRFMSVVTQCIEHYDCDHKLFIESFLTWNNTPFAWHDGVLHAQFEKTLLFYFEPVGDKHRLTKATTVTEDNE